MTTVVGMRTCSCGELVSVLRYDTPDVEIGDGVFMPSGIPARLESTCWSCGETLEQYRARPQGEHGAPIRTTVKLGESELIDILGRTFRMARAAGVDVAGGHS